MALPFETGGMHWMVEVNGKTWDFCVPPRCGSHSMRHMLSPLPLIPWHDHADVKVNVLRHPVPRLVSAFMVRASFHGCDKDWSRFVDLVVDTPDLSDTHMRPQVEFWSPVPDYVLCLETIKSDWLRFVDDTGFPVHTYPHKYKSEGDKPTPTDEQRCRIEQHYGRDMAIYEGNDDDRSLY